MLNDWQPMLIACDVDGVVVSLLGELLRRYNRDYQDTLAAADITGWEFHHLVKAECGPAVYDYFKDPDLYANLEPIDGAIAGVQRLRDLGHTVIFVTSCYYGMVDQKARWLERHGLCLPARSEGMLPDDLIVATSKHCLAADLLIDDAPHIIEKWVVGTQRRAIMVNCPYNVSLEVESWPLCYRANNWAEIVAHVEALGLDYEGFISPLVTRAFAEYMHRCRK